MQMQIVITTCGPYANFQGVLAILHQAGLDKESDAFIQWHDNSFGPSATIDPLWTDHKKEQGSNIEENIARFFTEAANDNLLLADSRCLWTLDFWAEKLPEARFLLFYSSAESALVYACQHEIEPLQALDSWQSASRQLLKFQRSHRRRAVLLNTEAAIRQPQALLNICQGIGITLQPLPPTTTRFPDQDILERYLAQQLVANQPEIQSLQVELEASAQPLDDRSPLKMQPLELLKRKSQQLLQQRKLQYQLDETVKKLQVAEHELNKQNTLQIRLKDQVNQLTQSSEEQTNLNIQQQTQLEKLQQTLETATKEITQENELLLLQLYQVQEELEKTFLHKHQLEQQLQQSVMKTKKTTTKELQHVQERDLKKQHQREPNLKHTLAWKITAPIRVITKLFKKLSKERMKAQEQIKLLRTCGLFNEAWYAAVNEDVVKSGYDPVEHYVLYGASEGRDPSPTFNTRRYLEINPDVAEAGMNPLVHYAKYGMAEKRSFSKS